MIARLLLAAALKCPQKGDYIKRMMQLDPVAKKQLMLVIQNDINSTSTSSKAAPSPAADDRGGDPAELRVLRERLREVEALAQREEAESVRWKEEAERATVQLKQAQEEAQSAAAQLAIAQQEKDALRGELRETYDAMRALEEKQLTLEASSASAERSRAEARKMRDDLDIAHEEIASLRAAQSAQSALSLIHI